MPVVARITSATDLIETTDTGKRRRLAPAQSRLDEDTLMLPVDDENPKLPEHAPRRTKTRWNDRRGADATIPDTPSDGWVTVGRSQSRWRKR